MTRHQQVSHIRYLLVVELEAYAQHGITELILPLSHVEQGLAEVSAEVKIHAHIERLVRFVLVIVEALAQLPAALPGLFVAVWSTGTAEDPFTVMSAKICQRVAKSPALLQSRPQGFDLGLFAATEAENTVVVLVV